MFAALSGFMFVHSRQIRVVRRSISSIHVVHVLLVHVIHDGIFCTADVPGCIICEGEVVVEMLSV